MSHAHITKQTFIQNNHWLIAKTTKGKDFIAGKIKIPIKLMKIGDEYLSTEDAKEINFNDLQKLHEVK